MFIDFIPYEAPNRKPARPYAFLMNDPPYATLVHSYHHAEAALNDLADAEQLWVLSRSILNNPQHWATRGKDDERNRLFIEVELAQTSFPVLLSTASESAKSLKLAAEAMKSTWKPQTTENYFIVSQYHAAMSMAATLEARVDRHNAARINASTTMAEHLASVLFSETVRDTSVPRTKRRVSLLKNLRAQKSLMPDHMIVVSEEPFISGKIIIAKGTDKEASFDDDRRALVLNFLAHYKQAVANLRMQKGILSEETYGLRKDKLKNKPTQLAALEADQRQRRLLVNSLRNEVRLLEAALRKASFGQPEVSDEVTLLNHLLDVVDVTSLWLKRLNDHHYSDLAELQHWYTLRNYALAEAWLLHQVELQIEIANEFLARDRDLFEHLAEFAQAEFRGSYAENE